MINKMVNIYLDEENICQTNYKKHLNQFRQRKKELNHYHGHYVTIATATLKSP